MTSSVPLRFRDDPVATPLATAHIPCPTRVDDLLRVLRVQRALPREIGREHEDGLLRDYFAEFQPNELILADLRRTGRIYVLPPNRAAV